VARTKTAVITGSTSAIGAAVAQALSVQGMRVYLSGRNATKLAALARRIPARRLAGCAVADLRSLAQVKALLQRIQSALPRIDVLIHCAGEHCWTAPGSLDSEAFAALFELNVRAPYLLTHGLTPQLAGAKGLVIFLNSSVVRGSGEGVALYKASRHALQGFTDSMRQDLNRRGIRVSSVFPGRTATPRMRRIYAHERRPYKPGALLSPQVVAQVVLALSTLPARAEVTDVHLRSATPY
jgi:NAD(P)-dependent dehydrogenase (short-subunit alcohol dehydrogenase family)